MNWTQIWMNIFGTTSFMGIDMGFWVSMGISAIVAFSMIIGFWGTKPYNKKNYRGKSPKRGRIKF